MVDVLAIAFQAADVAVFAGGIAWRWLLTLPVEIFAVLSILLIAFVAYEWIEYSQSHSFTGIALFIVAIIFVIVMLFIFL